VEPTLLPHSSANASSSRHRATACMLRVRGLVTRGPLASGRSLPEGVRGFRGTPAATGKSAQHLARLHRRPTHWRRADPGPSRALLGTPLPVPLDSHVLVRWTRFHALCECLRRALGVRGVKTRRRRPCEYSSVQVFLEFLRWGGVSEVRAGYVTKSSTAIESGDVRAGPEHGRRAAAFRMQQRTHSHRPCRRSGGHVGGVGRHGGGRFIELRRGRRRKQLVGRCWKYGRHEQRKRHRQRRRTGRRRAG